MAKYTKEAILQMAEEEDVEFIRLQFTDMFGVLKNVAITSSQLGKALDNKCMFDGSSVEGFVRIEESDMYLYPDYDTFEIFPWRPQQGKVARLICDVYTPDGKPFEGDPRWILKKVIKEAEDMGYVFEVGPECEFFLFHTDDNGLPTTLSHEKAGYFDLGPTDLGENVRRDMVLTLEDMGFEIEASHHEVAPGQHELAPIFSTSNISADHNQLTMELMKSIAGRHGLVCLLHEKPFAGVNGSGKHNNWSLSTDEGTNLLEPGDKPEKNTQFLLFLVAVITAVDEYQDMLRMTVSSAGNDHRLGANEAPPAIVSMFLGDELTAILEAIDAGSNYHGDAKRHMEIGISMLPSIPRDTTDRNRTSPFAFTGNKFEFRMPGSSCSISGPNIAINTAVADVLRGFADTLEMAEDLESALSTLIAGSLRAHKRIIFNGNNYSDEWVQEAKRRGLSNYRSTPEALPSYISEKNVAAFRRNGVLSEGEIHSRYEIHLENYCKTLHIEALTMVDMVKQLIIPAVLHYQRDLAGLLERKQTLSSFDSTLEGYLLERISTLSGVLLKKLQALESAILDTRMPREQLEQAHFYRESVFTAMNELRLTADELETLVGKSYWPIPSYGDILYSVN